MAVFAAIHVGNGPYYGQIRNMYSGPKSDTAINDQVCREVDKLLREFPFETIYVDIWHAACQHLTAEDDKPWTSDSYAKPRTS